MCIKSESVNETFTTLILVNPETFTGDALKLDFKNVTTDKRWFEKNVVNIYPKHLPNKLIKSK